MTDNASFNRQEAEEAFGRWSMCFKCSKKRAQDLHHIMKKGYSLGFRKDDPRRKMMSSLFNCSPLCGNCHSYGGIHRDDGILLRKTKQWLDTVHYIPNKIDAKFLDSFSHYYG